MTKIVLQKVELVKEAKIGQNWSKLVQIGPNWKLGQIEKLVNIDKLKKMAKISQN